MDDKIGWLIADDIKEPIRKMIPKELIENIPIWKGKIISGTTGPFDEKDFERIARRLKDD